MSIFDGGHGFHTGPRALRLRERAERRSAATPNGPPTPDIAAIEKAAESLMRFGDIRNAIALWAIALRLREERRDDAVT